MVQGLHINSMGALPLHAFARSFCDAKAGIKCLLHACSTALTAVCLPTELMMEDPNDAVNSYEAGIFSRLEGVKAAYDPNNLFRDLHYVHPSAQRPKDIFHGGIPDALPFAAADAMAPAPDLAMSGAEAPQPMQ